ncbi:hypothetical protein MKZ38_000776 [Zalerion maritima]|uniref:NADAR domain-containing protein n=1 Tax=Zalerion maritima TaxID=339359 RepID=A0AAD5RFG5_9PEZI|nr:hypothetical protein MKZ38_000776 [Zalerion maritima]
MKRSFFISRTFTSTSRSISYSASLRAAASSSLRNALAIYLRYSVAPSKRGKAAFITIATGHLITASTSTATMPTTRSGKQTGEDASSSSSRAKASPNDRSAKSKTGERKKSHPNVANPANVDSAVNNDSDDIVYFWRDTDVRTGWLSQWYQCAFEDDEGRAFASAEHYMMYHKALLFSSPLAATLLSDPSSPEFPSHPLHPRDVKGVGRKVKNFDQKVWDARKMDIVTNASYFKFKNPVAEQEEEATTDSTGKGMKVKELGGLTKMLMQTGDKEIVEASPYDRIWGIGMKEVDARRCQGRGKWGQNLLGQALVVAREKLRKENEKEVEKTEAASEEKVGDGDVEMEGNAAGAEEETKLKEQKKGGDIAEDWVEV